MFRAKKKDVTVRFMGDDDFIENIRDIDLNNSECKRDIKYDQTVPDEISDEDVDENYKLPSGLSQTQDEIEGQELPKSTVATTPKGKKIASKGTPSRSTGKSRAKKALKSPKHNVKQNGQVNSPYSLRPIKPICLNEQEWISDLENSDSCASDDSNSSEELATPIRNKETASPRHVKKNMENMGESYFAAQKNKKSATSNRTMSKVVMPKTNIEDLKELLSNTSEYHIEERSKLYSYYKSLFNKWVFSLEAGFNILLYGAGSKFELLQKFYSKCLSDEDVGSCVTINGFFPSLTIKQILNSITEEVIETDQTFSTIFEQADFIKEHFVSENENLFIVVHNIDGSPLRNHKTQSVLSSLASCAKIHFIASVDHINCSLIWDQIMLSQFTWVWYNVPTYEPYILELSYENSLLQKQSCQLLLSSLMHVFKSLTPNNQGVFLILAKHQMEKKESGNYLGVTFNDWYQECREAFLVNSKTTMNAQISEFKNHKLLSSRKSSEGIEYWYIPIDSQTLSQFMEKDDI